MGYRDPRVCIHVYGYVHIYIYVYTSKCIYIYIYMYMYVCMYVYLCVCTWVYIYLCTGMYIRLYTCVSVNMWIYCIYISICTCKCIWIQDWPATFAICARKTSRKNKWLRVFQESIRLFFFRAYLTDFKNLQLAANLLFKQAYFVICVDKFWLWLETGD